MPTGPGFESNGLRGLVLLNVFDGCANQQLIVDRDFAKALRNCFVISRERGGALHEHFFTVPILSYPSSSRARILFHEFLIPGSEINLWLAASEEARFLRGTDSTFYPFAVDDIGILIAIHQAVPGV